MILSTRFRWVAGSVMFLLTGLPSAAGDKALLMRSFPTDVTWGEISVAQGPAIEVLVRKDRVACPFTLAITCDQRERREDVNDLAGQAVVTPARRRGAIYFATQLPAGRDAWKGVVEKITARLAGLTPETFGTFVQTFRNTLVGSEPVVEGAFEGVICMTVEGQSDQAWEVHRTIDKNGVATGASGFSDPKPICSELVGPLEGEPASDVLASRFQVRAQREESLTVIDTLVSGGDHAAWPSGAGIAYAEAPKGAKVYSNSGENDGAVWYEELRPARDGGPPPTKNPYLLKATSRNATIPTVGLDSDALLARWTWRVRDVILGTEPKTSDHEVAVLNTAFLFAEAHGRTDPEEFERTVARDFASSDLRPGPSLLQGLMKKHGRYLGADAMFVVFCDPTLPRKATYCVASACQEVMNAEDFCDALTSRLDLLPTR